VAWRSSRLTTDGCPVEFAFSNHDAAFRATLEPAPPEIPEHAKLSAALNMLDSLGLAQPAESLVCEWRALQAGLRLRWGCWLGLRVTSAGPRPKLYIELPHGYPSPLSGGRPRMLGHDPVDGITEVYVNIVEPTENRIRQLLPVDCDLQTSMLAALAEVIGVPLGVALDWVDLGASIARSPGQRDRVALFCRARAVRGGPVSLRGRFAAHPGYRALLSDVPVALLPDHGVLTFIPAPGGAFELRVGVSAAGLAK
jgi:hypothetical protein